MTDTDTQTTDQPEVQTAPEPTPLGKVRVQIYMQLDVDGDAWQAATDARGMRAVQRGAKAYVEKIVLEDLREQGLLAEVIST